MLSAVLEDHRDGIDGPLGRFCADIVERGRITHATPGVQQLFRACVGTRNDGAALQRSRLAAGWAVSRILPAILRSVGHTGDEAAALDLESVDAAVNWASNPSAANAFAPADPEGARAMFDMLQMDLLCELVSVR